MCSENECEGYRGSQKVRVEKLHISSFLIICQQKHLHKYSPLSCWTVKDYFDLFMLFFFPVPWPPPLQDEFDKLRPLCYTSVDVFLLCFSVVNPASFQNVPEKWVPEIRKHAPLTPLILVGTQCDLREDVKVQEMYKEMHFYINLYVKILV